MPRVTHRLSAAAINNLGRSGLHCDGNGLYLRVTDGGSKGWIFRFKWGGRLRDMGLGAFPGISLSAARELAGEARYALRRGEDPIALRQAQRAAEGASSTDRMTFKACAEKFVGSHEAGWRNAKHRQQWRNTLKTYAHPVLGELPVGDVDTEAVLRVLQQDVDVGPGKAARLWTARPETASRLRGRIEAVLAWAKARGLRQGENPAVWRGHLDRLLPAKGRVRRVRHHPALAYSDLPAFMRELRQREGVTARALEFTILTGSRTGEAIAARFDEIDLQTKLWTVPAERMKASRAHRVPLSARASTIVQQMAEVRVNEFLFPGAKQGRHLSDMALLMLLRDLRPGITTHGFRSTFKDWAAERTDTPNFISEAALAHVVADKVEAAYRRADLLDRRRRLMDAWARYCESQPAAVLALRRDQRGTS